MSGIRRQNAIRMVLCLRSRPPAGSTLVAQVTFIQENLGFCANHHDPRPICCGSGSGYTQAPTPLTLPNMDVKRADDRPHRRQIFLVLHRQPRFDHRTGTAGTHGRQRRIMGLVDVSGDGSVSRPPIRRARLSTGPPRVQRTPILRERRGLPTAGAPRGLEFSAQALVLAAQPFVLPPQRLAIPPGAIRTFAQRIDLVACRGRVAGPFIWHVDVMPDPPKKYKHGILDQLSKKVNREARTR